MTSRVIRRGAIALAVSLGCSSPTGGNGTGLPLGAASVQLDIPFCAGGPLQRIDLYFPHQRNATPTPVVLHLHGGGWIRGDKTSGPWFLLVGEELIARNLARPPAPA